MQKSEIVLLYETILSIPGMNEPIKLCLHTTRKNLLLLSLVLERGLKGENENNRTACILDIISSDMSQELGDISEEILKKGGLFETYEKLKTL